MKSITSRISIRLMAPILVVMALTGFLLYIFVLRTVSGFAESEVRKTLAELKHDIYTICETKHADILYFGTLGDERLLRIQKRRVLAMLDEFALNNKISLMVSEGGKEMFRTGVRPGPDVWDKGGELSSGHHHSEVYFQPWQWEISVYKDTQSFMPLLAKVRVVYGVTFGGLSLAVIALIVFFDLTLGAPVRGMVRQIRDGRPPSYSGIYEYEFLSKSISSMMESLRKEQEDLEEIIARRNTELLDSYSRLKEEVDIRSRIENELIRTRNLESLGILAGGIAHDFNNILGAILNNVTLAKMYMNPEESSYAKLSEIEKIYWQATHLTRQLMTFSKGDEPVKEPVDVEGMLRDTVSFALSGSNTSCVFALPSALWDVEVDRGQVSQVINNMVFNARDAMPDGGNLRVEAENITVQDNDAQYEPGRYVRLTIIDSGMGIDEDSLTRIFDPFFTTKDSGSGLGLSISYSIIKKHGGYVDVKSTVGLGASFAIMLPATQRRVAPREELPAIVDVGGLRVLVVDDDAIIRQSLSEMLELMGFEVAGAQDGAGAIKQYSEAHDAGVAFDVVIMDLTLPGGMGGKKATEDILKLDPEARVLISSGYSDDIVVSDYGSYGFCGALIKPYSIEALMGEINRVMSGSCRD